MHDGHFADPATVSTPPQSLIARISPQAFAAGVYVTLAAITFASMIVAAGGHLVYALDDPYIHLALAANIASGHYGINAGEVTSPSSSVIWPFLLIPGAGTAVHTYVPLVLNLVCGLIAAMLCGRLVAALPSGPAGSPKSDADALTRLVIAGLMVLGINLIGLAVTGMEHSGQIMLSVAVAVGLIEATRGRPLPAWLLAAAIIAPAVRYEMFAITVAVAIVMLGRRNWLQALAVIAASMVLPVALGVFLAANGSAPLPNSVLTKLNLAGSQNGGLSSLFAKLVPSTWAQNLPFKILMWMVIGALAFWTWREPAGPRRWLLAAATVVGVLHMMFGRFGWFFRYEVYAFAFCGLIALWRLAEEVAPRFLAYAVAVPALLYSFPMLEAHIASRNIHEQQYQMARFVSEHYRKPFAVNDLGLVSYMRDPGVYVLDLWGLASNEAVRVRRKDKNGAWLDNITRRHGTGLVMIFDHWFVEQPKTWTKVGELKLAEDTPVRLASDTVAIYATAVGDAGEIRARLAAFKPTLPPGVRLNILPPN